MSETTTNNGPEESTPPAAGKRLSYAPPAAMMRLRQWARDTFAKEQLVSALKQFAWVAPLTILIWVYAEREQQSTARGIRFAVELTSNNENVDVRLVEPADGYLSADITGPRARLDEMRGELGTRGTPVRYEVPRDLPTGEHQIPVTAVVNRDKRFDGVTLAASEPARITVLVDPIDVESVPVEVRQEDRKTFDQVTFSPERVRVRIPREVKKDAMAAGGGKLVAYANLAALPDKTPGRKNNIPDVRVHVLGTTDDARVKIEPGVVSASLTVKQADEVFTLRQVPVYRGGAAAVLDDVNVEQSPDQRVLFDVDVVGPPELIAQIRQKPELVQAWLTIEESDIGVGEKEKTVWYKLPEGVTIHPEDANKKVRVTVKTRTSAGS